jgi:hypothetical protein
MKKKATLFADLVIETKNSLQHKEGIALQKLKELEDELTLIQDLKDHQRALKIKEKGLSKAEIKKFYKLSYYPKPIPKNIVKKYGL